MCSKEPSRDEDGDITLLKMVLNIIINKRQDPILTMMKYLNKAAEYKNVSLNEKE